MKVLREEDLPLKEEVAVAIGLFDGVHLGHIALLDELHSFSNTLIYTFNWKPKDYQNIYTEEEKQSVLEGFGITYYYVQTFDDNFANQSPEQFLQNLKERFHVTHITVGFDFRFGKNAEGDTTFLKENQKKYGYSLCVVPEVLCGTRKVSSTEIRGLIARGEVGEAAELLTRGYFVDGKIEEGARIGRTIGFPTANIVTNKLLPAFGVYATLVQLGDQLYKGVTNVGVKPTVTEENRPNIETYIMGFDGQAYGEDIRVYFVQRLREEIRFANVEELKVQIEKDKEHAAALLNEEAIYKKYII